MTGDKNRVLQYDNDIVNDNDLARDDLNESKTMALLSISFLIIYAFLASSHIFGAIESIVILGIIKYLSLSIYSHRLLNDDEKEASKKL